MDRALSGFYGLFFFLMRVMGRRDELDVFIDGFVVVIVVRSCLF